jgi:hypothetical protein
MPLLTPRTAWLVATVLSMTSGFVLAQEPAAESASEAATEPVAEPEAASDAQVDEATTVPLDNRWTLRGILFGSVGPLKGTGLIGVNYRHITNRSENILFDKTYVATGLDVYANPSTPGAQLWFEWLPIAILKIKVSYDAIVYSGAELGYGYGLTFPSPDADFGPDTLKARKGQEQSELNHRLSINPTLQLKLWRIILLNETELSAWYVHGPEGEWWYETFYDTLIKRGEIDGVVSDRTMLLFEAWKGVEDEKLLVGVVNQFVHSFSSEIQRDRLGAALIYTPWQDLGGIARPTLVLMPGVTLLDRNRQYDFWLEAAIVLSWDFHQH